jgi:molybdopterin molybdotransferase
VLARMLGLADTAPQTRSAILGQDLPANDRRQDYLRATTTLTASGQTVATPFERQDSSMLATLARADCLIVRPPHAPPARAGDPVEIVPLRDPAATL